MIRQLEAARFNTKTDLYYSYCGAMTNGDLSSSRDWNNPEYTLMGLTALTVIFICSFSSVIVTLADVRDRLTRIKSA